jgi:flagellar hook-associated protein 1 FlgK
LTLSESSGAVKFNSGNSHSRLDLRDKTVFDANTTLSDGYVAVFSSVASTLRESKFSAEFSTAQAASAETQRANKAGVNLDEEAALLIQYQQAYQASAKYMGTVQSLFDTLMSAFR